MQETQFNTLRDYINKAYENGLKDEQIIEQLTAAGWQKDDIMLALRSVKSAQAYATPTNVSSVPFGHDGSQQFKPVQQDTSKLNASKLPKYKVLTAFGDSFNAMVNNFSKLLLSGFITLLAYIIFLVISMAAFFAIFMASGSDGSTYGGGLVIVYLIAATAFMIWYQALFITGISIPIKDSIEAETTSAKGLVKDMFTKSWWVALVEVGFYLIVFGPLIILGVVSSLIFGGVLGTLILFLGGIVWFTLSFLRFYLAPYVALFDKSVSYVNTFSKSYDLLKGGGQWFLVKLILLLLVGYILFGFIMSFLSFSSAEYTSISSGILGTLAYMLFIFFVAVVINGVSVALYLNRSNLLDPENNMRNKKEPKQFNSNAAASPISNINNSN